MRLKLKSVMRSGVMTLRDGIMGCLQFVSTMRMVAKVDKKLNISNEPDSFFLHNVFFDFAKVKRSVG